MNSTQLSIAAGEALAEYGQTHNEACVLSQNGGIVRCSPVFEGGPQKYDSLWISHYELKNGMKNARWNSIGTALLNLYTKELSCQAHRKH